MANEDESKPDYRSKLKAVLMERHLRDIALPTKVIGYLDMLGFGALVFATSYRLPP